MPATMFVCYYISILTNANLRNLKTKNFSIILKLLYFGQHFCKHTLQSCSFLAITKKRKANSLIRFFLNKPLFASFYWPTFRIYFTYKYKTTYIGVIRDLNGLWCSTENFVKTVATICYWSWFCAAAQML